MEILQKEAKCEGIRFYIEDTSGKEVGVAFLYIMENTSPNGGKFGLMEYVYIDEKMRGQGLGTQLVKKIIQTAKEKGCYKLIATSRNARPKVHDLYIKLGFTDHGKEFRIDFGKVI